MRPHERGCRDSDHLTSKGGSDDSASIKAAGRGVGHSESSTLKRARAKLHVTTEAQGYPRRTYWSLPDTQPGQSDHVSRTNPGESGLTELTEPTGPNWDSVSPVGSVGSVGPDPARATPLELT